MRSFFRSDLTSTLSRLGRLTFRFTVPCSSTFWPEPSTSSVVISLCTSIVWRLPRNAPIFCSAAMAVGSMAGLGASAACAPSDAPAPSPKTNSAPNNARPPPPFPLRMRHLLGVTVKRCGRAPPPRCGGCTDSVLLHAHPHVGARAGGAIFGRATKRRGALLGAARASASLTATARRRASASMAALSDAPPTVLPCTLKNRRTASTSSAGSALPSMASEPARSPCAGRHAERLHLARRRRFELRHARHERDDRQRIAASTAQRPPAERERHRHDAPDDAREGALDRGREPEARAVERAAHGHVELEPAAAVAERAATATSTGMLRRARAHDLSGRAGAGR